MKIDEIDCFIFDLDETLYPFGQFLSRERFFTMLNAFAAEQNRISITEAARITQDFMAADPEDCDIILSWKAHGRFDFDAYCAMIDSIALETLRPCMITRHALEHLPGRKIIFTNAHTSHALRVLEHLQLDRHIDYMSDYVSRGFRKKPTPEIYAELIAEQGIDPKRAAMFEDCAFNLKPAHELGMTCVLCHPAPAPQELASSHVHHHFDNFTDWVRKIGYLPD